MRILHVLSQTIMTGAEVYAQNLIQHQHQSGHEVFVISEKLHVALPVSWLSLPTHQSRFLLRLKTIWKIRQFIIKNKIQAIHCHSRGAVRHCYWAKLGLKVAMISTIHGRQHASTSKKLLDIYGDLKLTVCENIHHQFVHEFKSQSASIKTLRNPIDFNKFAFQNEILNSVSWLYAGRVSGPKGEALKILFEQQLWTFLNENQKVQLDLIIPTSDGLDPNFFKQLQDHPQIKILSKVVNLADTIINYGLVFGAGRVAIEALATGIPVYAFGEYTCHGFITQNNFQEALKTNFGDIGLTAKPSFDFSISLNDYRLHQDQPQRLILRQMALKEFSAESINQKIIQHYQDCLFKKYHPQHIPVLMYHKIPDRNLDSPHRIFVTKENFENHLIFFKKNHFTPLHFQDLLNFLNEERDWSEFPKKPIIITFDDGYQDNFINALPLLNKYQTKAVFYFLSDSTILFNNWDQNSELELSKIMTLEEKKEFTKNQLVEIGSHSINHPHLTALTENEILNQMKESKKQLEETFQKKILSFAYPFGSSHEKIYELCEKAGYHFAVNTDRGGLYIYENRFAIFRVNIFPEDDLIQLKKKTSTWYRKYFFYKRGH
jgi:peptidoglycan/xylan/chitin deacetylase (PgdA/CDA1 family)/glycosyltransferase involved in cell wall biosynthesis